MGDYLTTEDVAQRLDVRVETVRRWVRTGRLMGVSIGKAGYRIRYEDFEYFARGQQRRPDVAAGEGMVVERSSVAQAAMEATATMILERMTDGVLLFGFDERCLYANVAAGRLLGLLPDELERKTLDELLPLSLLEVDAPNLRDGDDYFSLATQGWYQIRLFTTPQGRCLTFVDITERKMAEVALGESEQRFRRLVETYAQAVWETNAAGEVVLDSPSWRAYTGQTFEEWIGYGWLNAIHADDREYAEHQWREAVAVGREVDAEFRLVYAKGGYRWTNVRATPLFTEEGRIAKWVGMNIDIHDRKRAEEELQIERAVLESFYNGVPFMMGVAELDGDKIIAVSANQRVADFFGRTPDDFSGRSGLEMGTPQEIENLWYEQYRKCQREGRVVAFAYRDSRVPGIAWLNVTLSFIGSGLTGRPRFSFVVEDITERKRIQEALIEAEKRVQAERQRLYDLFMNAPAAIMVIRGPQHVYELTNPLALRIMGTHRPIIGKTVREVLPEAEEQGFLDLLDNVYRTGQPFIGNEMLGQFDNTGGGTLVPAYFNFVYQPSYDAAKKIDGILCYVNDVTETVLARKRAEENEQRLRALADSVPHLVWSARGDGTIDFFNERVNEYAEIPRDEEGVYDWQAIVHPDDRESAMDNWEYAVRTEKAFEQEIRFRMKDGSYRWHLIRGVATYDADGRVSRWYGTKTDIEQLKQLDQQKNDFLGVVSHELKTPVTSAKAFAEVLESRAHRAGDEGSALLLGKLGAQMDKLIRLIGDLLDITRLDAGKLSFYEALFSFDELVDAIHEEVQRTTTHVIEKEGRTGKMVYGDRERLGQVMSNLLTNAIKYSPDAMQVVMSSTATEQEVTFCVQDFGIGIARDKVPHVFERFFRENEGREDTFAGLGLGLYVSAQIIERQGGRMWVDSEKGVGSTFCFRVPLQREIATQ
jgi:PAS domain S-box-containing protein/excisionase family DNA binding protein